MTEYAEVTNTFVRQIVLADIAKQASSIARAQLDLDFANARVVEMQDQLAKARTRVADLEAWLDANPET